MKRFVGRLALFSFVVLLLIIVGITMPVTPRAPTTLLFSKVKKDSLLYHSKQPRIVFLGGSNLSFGLNSQMIKDSLGLNPINMGIHASLGLEYMLNSVLEGIKQGDILVVSAEYDQFYDKFAYGDEELVRLVLDLQPASIFSFSKEQIESIYAFIPKYAFSKFNIVEYVYTKEDPVYGVHSFNQYGDASAHWGLKAQKFAPYREIDDHLNEHIIKVIKKFQAKTEAKGAKLLFTFPAYQAKSFANSEKEIFQVEKVLKQNGLTLISTPNEYKFADSLFFNTPYHLIKKGVDKRTELLITDLKRQGL